MNAARDLSPFFVPRSIAVVGAGEGAISSGGAIMQMLRQAGYGGRVVPVNPKGGTIFRYETVTSIGAIDPPRALPPDARTPVLHSMKGTLPGKAEWFAAMERAGVPMFNDVEEMAEAAGLLARYPRLRTAAQSDNLSAAIFRDRRGS
jgi:acyl-CoA synthetase (NDP forming)